MTRPAGHVWIIVCLTLAPYSHAGDLTEVLCENDPYCSNNNLSVLFEGDGGVGNVFTYSQFTPGMRVTATIMMSTVGVTVQGWSYSVAHDDADLSLVTEDLTVEGTDAQAVIDAHPEGVAFVQQTTVRYVENGTVKAGLIAALVLDLKGGVVLPVQDNSILKATYTLKRDVGTAGTCLRIAHDELAFPGSPRIRISITDNGVSLLPRLLTHGQIRNGAGTTVCSVAAAYADGNLSLQFELGTPQPTIWSTFLASSLGVTPLWSLPLGVIDPPVGLPLLVQGFPRIGTVAILSVLIGPDGITCADVAVVDTGRP